MISKLDELIEKSKKDLNKEIGERIFENKIPEDFKEFSGIHAILNQNDKPMTNFILPENFDLSKFLNGSEFKTRGGWKAIKLHKQYFLHFTPDGFKKRESFCNQYGPQEDSMCAHESDGTAVCSFAVHLPPYYNGHPADIVGVWDDKSDE